MAKIKDPEAMAKAEMVKMNEDLAIQVRNFELQIKKYKLKKKYFRLMKWIRFKRRLMVWKKC